MLARSTSTNKPDVVVHVHTPNYIGNIGSRVMVQGSPGQKPWGLMWKIIKAKRTGVMAQKVRYLPSKCEALNSNPSTAKKKKRYITVSTHECVSCPFSPLLTIKPKERHYYQLVLNILSIWIIPKGYELERLFLSSFSPHCCLGCFWMPPFIYPSFIESLLYSKHCVIIWT
jgi:hypothetical protein